MRKYYPEHMDILCRKNFYPYEYIDNDSKLDELGLPTKESLFTIYTKKV